MASLRVLGLLLLLLTPGLLLAEDRPDEYAVKAVYLYKLGLFVRWPESAFSDSSAPLVVAVVGRDPFGKTLDKALSGKTLAGRQVELRRYRSVTDLDDCHILFIGERAWVRDVLDQVRDRPVLTVGETDDFLDSGGILRFLLKKGQVRFQVGGRQAQRSGLNISSKLLQLSE